VWGVDMTDLQKPTVLPKILERSNSRHKANHRWQREKKPSAPIAALSALRRKTKGKNRSGENGTTQEDHSRKSWVGGRLKAGWNVLRRLGVCADLETVKRGQGRASVAGKGEVRSNRWGGLTDAPSHRGDIRKLDLRKKRGGVTPGNAPRNRNRYESVLGG